MQKLAKKLKKVVFVAIVLMVAFFGTGQLGKGAFFGIKSAFGYGGGGGGSGVPVNTASQGGVLVTPNVPVVIPTTPVVTLPAGQVLGVKIELVDELVASTKFGTRSNDVKLLQDELKRLGFFPKNISSTGFYGSITKAAVGKYLASKTGQVLGVKITRADDLIAITKFGGRGAEVSELQTLLKQAGFFPSKQAVTGFYGSITRTAVAKYLASK